jgi:hypothetical protein
MYEQAFNFSSEVSFSLLISCHNNKTKFNLAATRSGKLAVRLGLLLTGGS